MMQFRKRMYLAALAAAIVSTQVFAQTPSSEPTQFQPSAPAAAGHLPPVQPQPPLAPATSGQLPGNPVIQPPTPNIPAPSLPAPALAPALAPVAGVPASVTSAGVPALAPTSTMLTQASATTQPVLTVKQYLPETVIPGQAVTAEVIISNAGSKTADNVVLTGWWTSGYDLSEASVVAQTVNGRRAWGLGALAAGETRSIKLKLSPQPGVTITEFRSGFDATFSSATDTRAVKVLKPELQLQMVCPEVAFVGQPVVVQLKVKNPTAMPLTNINIRTLLPETLAHPKGSNLESELAVLQAGATEVIPLDLTCVKSGDGRMRVKITAAACDPIEQEMRLNSMEARLAVTLNGPKSLYQNWPATYEAVIENQGDQPIKAATFEVKLPAGFTDLRASDKPGYDSASHRIVWKFDAVQPGEKKTIIWFGFGKQAEDLVTTGLITVSGAPLKRAEWVTKNLGAEAK
jgi:hypothetical protein